MGNGEEFKQTAEDVRMSVRPVRYVGGPFDGQIRLAQADECQIVGAHAETGQLRASGVYHYDREAGVFRWHGDLVSGLEFAAQTDAVLERIADPDAEWTPTTNPATGAPAAYMTVEKDTGPTRYSVNPRPGSTDTVDGLIRDLRDGAIRILERRNEATDRQ